MILTKTFVKSKIDENCLVPKTSIGVYRWRRWFDMLETIESYETGYAKLFDSFASYLSQLAHERKHSAHLEHILNEKVNTVANLQAANTFLVGLKESQHELIAGLNAQLKALKPPEPKFRVNQVVVITATGGVIRIGAIRHNGQEPVYISAFNSISIGEEGLRALAESEK